MQTVVRPASRAQQARCMYPTGLQGDLHGEERHMSRLRARARLVVPLHEVRARAVHLDPVSQRVLQPLWCVAEVHLSSLGALPAPTLPPAAPISVRAGRRRRTRRCVRLEPGCPLGGMQLFWLRAAPPARARGSLKPWASAPSSQGEDVRRAGPARRLKRLWAADVPWRPAQARRSTAPNRSAPAPGRGSPAKTCPRRTPPSVLRWRLRR